MENQFQAMFFGRIEKQHLLSVTAGRQKRRENQKNK